MEEMNQVQEVQKPENGPVQMDRLTFFRSYYESVRLMSNENRLKMYDAIFAYAFENKEVLEDTTLISTFIIIKALIDKEMSKNGPNGPSINKNKKKNKNTNMNKNIFVQFWSKYPRKEKKIKCQEWFENNEVSDEEFEKMLSSLSEFIKTEQWQNKKYIPLATTWLNQRRWEDEITCDDVIESEDDEIARLQAEINKQKANGEWK